MSPMSEQPITLAVLAQFHREIVVPDIKQIVGESELRLRDEIHTFHDAILRRLAPIETEYEFLKVGLARVEGRLDQLDQRLGRIDGRLDRIDQRLDVLESQYRDLLAGLHRLEERLARIEKNVDELGAAREKEPLRAEVADLRTRVDGLQAQVRTLEKRFDQ